MNLLFAILLVLLGLFAGIACMFIFNYLKEKNALKKADNIINQSKKDAEKIKRDYLLEAKEESYKLKKETDQHIKERKEELKEAEERLYTRESSIDRRDQSLQNRENLLEEKENNLINKQKNLEEDKVKIEELKKEQVKELEKIAGYTEKQAKKLVLEKVEEMMEIEIGNYIKEKEAEAKLEVDKKAKSMLVTSMQRYAGDVASDQTVSVVNLPSDDMKGRIIGREGRNIRAIEAVTGVDLIIDDTPEAIVLSSFDPYRREIARITIETLIKDGRIHPTRIEELYDKTSKDIKAKVMEHAENALFELGITKMDPELMHLVGKLHFRTSFGQNALTHSIEVAHISGIMAGEIGENIALAKRAGLLHDIGKSVDHEIEGSHVTIGAELARKYRENETVINSIESHHGDVPATSVISEIVAVADALSASRPGARNDSLENYIKRLKDLENIANEMEGIEKSFAVQAGRELRVIVKADLINDAKSHKVARDIKNKIESTLQYPGTIKITVIRETRATEEAI